jgi:hypothetical protein
VVEQRTHNPKVTGSIPVRANRTPDFILLNPGLVV